MSVTLSPGVTLGGVLVKKSGPLAVWAATMEARAATPAAREVKKRMVTEQGEQGELGWTEDITRD